MPCMNKRAFLATLLAAPLAAIAAIGLTPGVPLRLVKIVRGTKSFVGGVKDILQGDAVTVISPDVENNVWFYAESDAWRNHTLTPEQGKYSVIIRTINPPA